MVAGYHPRTTSVVPKMGLGVVKVVIATIYNAQYKYFFVRIGRQLARH